MLLPRFEYQEPKELQEAVELMDAWGQRAALLAGGTDLLVNLKKGGLKVARVVYLGRLEGLAGLESRADGLRLGPLVTAAQLAGSTAALGPAAVLAEAAGRLGSPLIRNRATLGGNLITARPAADLSPPLLALGASVVLTSRQGERTVALDGFFKGPGQTERRPEEILTSILVPGPGQGCGAAYEKLGARRTLEISMVSAAAYLKLDGDGTIRQARLIMGAVGPTPLRAVQAEDLLAGERPKDQDDPIFCSASLAAANEARPIDDHRGSAEYRRAMVEVLIRRVLGRAWLRAQGRQS